MTAATDLSSGQLQTTSTVEGKFYSFELIYKDQELLVHEITPPSEDNPLITLQLLATPDVAAASWAGELPIRLRTMHSHWYNSAADVILFRGTLFSKRATAFLVCDPQGSTSQCFRVPQHRRGEDWAFATLSRSTLTAGLDRLVLHDSKTSRVLAKFEESAFVHFYFDASTLKIELPRFKLRFECDSVDGHLHSLDYVGYHLDRQQQLPDTMSGFQRYLILKRDASSSAACEIKILIPQGPIAHARGTVVGIRVGMKASVGLPDSCQADVAHHAYAVHARFGDLRATSIESRLQLATVYAMTGTLLPDARLGMLGGEVAMELVRKCAVSRPLSHGEQVQLCSLSQACHRTPGLTLLCRDLELGSNQLAFLYAKDSTGAQAVRPLNLAAFHDAVTEYESLNRVWRSRGQLTAMEERHLLGKVVRRRPGTLAANSCAPKGTGSVEVTSCPIPLDFVEREEDALIALIQPDCQVSTQPPFPLANGANGTSVALLLRSELEASWDAHHDTLTQRLREGHTEAIWGCSRAVKDALQRTEEHLICCVSSVPESVGPRASSFRLRRITSEVPVPLRTDLVRSSWDKSVVPACNPWLSPNACKRVHEMVLLWEKLCVLADKLSRLVRLLSSTASDAGDRIQQELESRRVWSAEAHPRWLAFELEGGLQIRPKQYFVAKRMIDASASDGHQQPVVQLNMGEGKTRVILPMLALHYGSAGMLPRLTILSPILKEAHEHLHDVLTASLQGCKVSALPFVRDVDVSLDSLGAIRRSLRRCQLSHGSLLMAPEHRQSLHLKGVEYQIQIAAGNAGADVVARGRLVHALETEMEYVDILDESDEVLRPTTKLVYTSGSYLELPSLSVRSDMIQSVLRAINSDKSVAMLESDAVLLGDRNQWAGGFRALRLIPGASYDQHHQVFVNTIAKMVLEEPEPLHSLRWTQALAQDNRALLDMIQEFVTTGSAARADAMSNPIGVLEDAKAGVAPAGVAKATVDALGEQLAASLDASQMDAVYMLRGMLVHGLLTHCLEKRYRVDFGINPAGAKRIAVPFHGSDTPAPRAEFAHPDCGLVFTLLSYYNGGLAEAQVKQSFSTLLSLGRDAQHAVYSSWYGASKPHVRPSDVDKIDSIDKVDLSNSEQLALLCKYFKGNTQTVGFFLNHHVFSEEMLQFPYRIEATAWNLAQSPRRMVMGFSGTKDNKLLFPTQLCFKPPENEPGPGRELLGTDGKMIQLIASQASYHQLFAAVSSGETGARGAPDMHPTAASRSTAVNGGGAGTAAAPPAGTAAALAGDAGNWEPILKELVSRILDEAADSSVGAVSARTTALIDAGALMAGKSNAEVAEYLLAKTDAKCFRGVVFFSLVCDEWRVRNHQGEEWSKSSSPIHESDAFVYFDESRCRGADMKLAHDARAVLTLGPKMQKDKLMQAAARFRQLDRGQQITLVAPRDVDAQIRLCNKLEADADIHPCHVVSWTLLNSEHAVARWLPEWAKQGGAFCAVDDKPELALIAEVLDLKRLYSSSTDDVKASDAWALAKTADALSRNGTVISTQSARLLAGIDRCMNDFGREIEVETATLDQECERELEKEIELEQERQLQVEARAPRIDVGWTYAHASRCTTVDELQQVLPSTVSISSLASFVANRLDFGVDTSGLALSPRLFGTSNFFESCEAESGGGGDGNGEGPANAFLRWVDCALQLTSGQIVLVSEREADGLLNVLWVDGDSAVGGPTFKLPSMQHLNASMGEAQRVAAASLCLFRGETMYPEHLQLREPLKKVLEETPQSASIARGFVDLRGKHSCWDRSDLEKVATVFEFQ
jgi:hypothetical protein